MCEPSTMASAGISIMKAQAEAKAQKRAAANMQGAAISSMNSQADQANLKFEEENRTALQEAYDLSLQNRATEATFLVQAVENGVQGISVNEGYMALKNTTARGNNRFTQERGSREASHLNHLAGLHSQAGGRINSAAPTMSGRDVILAGVTAGVGAASDAGAFDDMKIGKSKS